MTDRAHAILSASSAHRWLECPPSALLCADAPDTAGEAAEQGTVAHALAEHRLKLALKRLSRKPKSELIDAEMERHSRDYARWVTKRAAQMGNPLVLIEERLDFSRWVPDGFGTADCILLTDGTLHVVDFKYGQGVVVDPTENPQMKLYALGALYTFGLLYDVEHIAMTIFQPRRDNVATWETSREELESWADDVLTPIAAKAAEGVGDFAAGDWCRWCAVRATCRARAEANLQLAQHEFRPAAELTDDEIAEVLEQLPQLTAWASDVQSHALVAATEHGKRWPGHKVVAGRSTRRYSDTDAVAASAIEAGADPEKLYDRKLIGVTALERLLGKKRFAEAVGPHIEKPPGKPTLVPISDPRPELATSHPESEFTTITQEEHTHV